MHVLHVLHKKKDHSAWWYFDVNEQAYNADDYIKANSSRLELLSWDEDTVNDFDEFKRWAEEDL